MKIAPYGDTALLVETEDPIALRDALAGTPGVAELVPAARTLLVRCDLSDAGVLAAIRAAVAAGAERRPGPLVELDVRYDGPDLAAVADAAGCSAEEAVRRHSGAEYVVAFCGFAPGFAYLRGLDPSLHVPRLDSPRTAVPAGSVGVAGEFTGVYPRSSPGGWRLLGHTDATLWDLSRDRPALLSPGTRVRFRPA